MLSIILASKVAGNPDSKIKNLLDSTTAYVAAEDYPKIEFLIKYDHEDGDRPHPNFFAQYPFPIKTFVYARGEGRHYNNHHCEYLFANRNPAFKWVMNLSDDFIFTRPFIKDIEAIQEEYMIVGHTRPTFELNARIGVYRNCFPQNFDNENGIGGYCPLITAKLIEVCQNWGWQPNTDAWVVLLEVTLYQRYGILLWKKIPPFYKAPETYGSGDTPTIPGTDLYNNMTITGMRIPQNKYLFDLIDQQARNIYLNIVHGSTHHVEPQDLEKIAPYFPISYTSSDIQ